MLAAHRPSRAISPPATPRNAKVERRRPLHELYQSAWCCASGIGGLQSVFHHNTYSAVVCFTACFYWWLLSGNEACKP